MLESGLYRTSSYLIDVKLENTNRSMLIHGYTGAMDIVSESVAAFFCEQKKFYKRSEVPFSEDAFLNFQKRGYIVQWVPEEEFEYVKRLSMALQKKDQILNAAFTFVVTYDCNFHCPYCFETLMRNKKKSHLVFTKEMVDKAYGAIQQIESRKELMVKTISLYGGEPLLKENRASVEYLVKTGQKYGFDFRAVTNGYDLDVYEDLLSPDLIKGLQITIDGIKAFHDQRRIHNQGYPTFDKIVSNIGLALNKGITVLVRVNTDRTNIEHLQSLKSLFDQLGYTANCKFVIDSALLRGSSDYNNSNNFTQKEFLEAHKQLKFKYGCHDYGTYMNIYKSIKDHKPLFFKASYCGAQMNSYALDPLGDIYPCWETIGLESSKIGSFLGNTIVWNEELRGKWHEHNVTASSVCRHCKYALLCGGGCKAHSINTDKTQCTNMAEILNYAVNRAYSML